MSPLVHVGKGKTQKGTITASQGSSKASSIARGSGEVSLGGSCTAPFCSPLLEWLQMGNRLHPMARPCKTMLCIPFSYATAMGLVHQPASKKGGELFTWRWQCRTIIHWKENFVSTNSSSLSDFRNGILRGRRRNIF